MRNKKKSLSSVIIDIMPSAQWAISAIMPVFLYFFAVSATSCLIFTGCSENHGENPESNATVTAKTDLLLGNVRILSDMHRVAMLSSCGNTGIWDTNSGRFEWQKSGLDNLRLLDITPEKESYLVTSEVRDSQNNRQEGFIDHMQMSILAPRTMAIKKSFCMPLGPNVGCWCADNTYAIGTWNQSENHNAEGQFHFGIWQNKGGRLINTLRFPEEGCTVATARRLDNSHIVLHLEVDTSSNEAASENSTSEIVVWDFVNGKICSRATTEIAADAMGRLSITQGSKQYATLMSCKRIEVRELPTLRVIGNRVLPKDSSASCAIVSGDGRYVVFGFSSVELWDLETDTICILDRLHEETINSPDFAPLSPSGEYLDRKLNVLDYARAVTQRTVANLRFSDDGKQLAMITHDGKYIIWDTTSWKAVRKSQLGPIRCLGKMWER